MIKWKGYAEIENTWEPAENLQCYGMINEFEEKYAKLQKPYYKYEPIAPTVRMNSCDITKLCIQDPDGFDKSWTCKRILGASQDEEGDILFLVQWYTQTYDRRMYFFFQGNYKRG